LGEGDRRGDVAAAATHPAGNRRGAARGRGGPVESIRVIFPVRVIVTTILKIYNLLTIVLEKLHNLYNLSLLFSAFCLGNDTSK
jgi:hypothetical protein